MLVQFPFDEFRMLLVIFDGQSVTKSPFLQSTSSELQ